MSKPSSTRREAENEAKAVLRNVRVSPRKLNLVAAARSAARRRPRRVNELTFSKKRIAQRREEGAAIGDRQRREQPQARRRPPDRGRGVGRQGPGHEAVPDPRPRPRRRHRQAVQPSHHGACASAPRRRTSNMGQKVNPIGLRLGINRTWDSRWYAEGGEYSTMLHEDIHIRKVLRERLARPASSKIVIERPAKKRPRHHPHRPSGRGDRQEGRRHREAARGSRQADQGRGGAEHRRDPQARDRRQADRREHRPAARAPRRLPPGDEARGAVGDASGRPGHPNQLRRAAWAAPRSPAWSGTAKAACRCTRCAPTSTTASPPPRPPSAPAASRCGCSRARSWRTTRWRTTSAPRKPRRSARRRGSSAPSRGTRKTIMLQPKRTKYRKATRAASAAPPRAARPRLRRLRPEGDGAGPPDRAPDRGGPPCHHPAHEACRPGLDPRVPGRAGVEEAGRGPHGLRQGRAGVLGGRVKPGRMLFELDGVTARSPRRRWRWRPPSCRSGPASSPASAAKAEETS